MTHAEVYAKFALIHTHIKTANENWRKGYETTGTIECWKAFLVLAEFLE